jgi:hypothetical protein
MKIKEEQKEVIKAVSSKMASKFVDDVKSAEIKSVKRPLVIFLLAIAGVGIMRDPMSLIIGIVAALFVAFIMSTTAEDLHKLTSSLSSKEEKAEAKKPEEKKE